MSLNRVVLVSLCMALLIPSLPICAQPASLKELLDLAENNYPLLKSTTFEIKAAEQNLEGTNRLFLPSLSASYQLNYATHNNISGMAYPQFLIPISGPPSAGNDFSGVFGSAASLVFNWQPVTFGRRGAEVDYAARGLQLATAGAKNEVFRHKVKVVDAYLDWLSAAALQEIYENDLERTEANLLLLYSLTSSGIRPGVDTAIFKAEVSKAKVALLNGRKQKELAGIYLSQLLATNNLAEPSDTVYFNKLPISSETAGETQHPLLAVFQSSIAVGEAKKEVISKSALPALGVWGTTWARGSGVAADGEVNTLDGLGLQRFNYGVGIQLSMPLLQHVKVAPLLEQQTFLIASNRERLTEARLQLQKQNEMADAALKTAYSIAAESPLFLESARFSFAAMQSRYQSGLTGVADLLQAQYALTKAETDYKLAYMAVWKAYLYKTAVSGDLNPFLNQVN